MLNNSEKKRNFMTQNPYLFIVGCPRSGTTLLQRMVDAHPEIAITPESHWIPRWFEKRKGLTPEGFVTPALIPSLLEYPRFRQLEVSRDTLNEILKADETLSYATFVTRIFDSYGKAHGKSLAGDKTPGYARRLRTLHFLWPTARFVHLIRDGRDVCLSAINWKRDTKNPFERLPTWIDDAVTTSALWWECNVRLAREARYELGSELYYELRYEALVANPEQECKALCRFLDVPFSDGMLRFHEGRTKAQRGLSAKKAWLPVTSGLRDWRTQMSPSDIERFEAAVGDLLEELGYPCVVQCPRPEVQKHATLIRGLCAKPLRRRNPTQIFQHRLVSANSLEVRSPSIFIVGCARSGTTLLHRVVDAHPLIAVTPEIHWITNLFKKRGEGLTGEGMVTPELLSKILAHKRFAQLEISIEAFENLFVSNGSIPYTDFLGRIFELYRTTKNKRLVGNKTPAYVRCIPVLHAQWPNAKFVHMIRDGRDVCLSIMNWKKASNALARYTTWNQDPISTIALWWMRNVRLGREAGNELGPDLYYEMRYEDLVTDPENECKSLCRFFQVPYDTAMVRFYQDGTRSERHYRGKLGSLPITSKLRDWQTQMAAEDAELFEAVAGELLEETGYLRAFPQLSEDKLEHASLMRGLITERFQSRGRLLPKAW